MPPRIVWYNTKRYAWTTIALNVPNSWLRSSRIPIKTRWYLPTTSFPSRQGNHDLLSPQYRSRRELPGSRATVQKQSHQNLPIQSLKSFGKDLKLQNLVPFSGPSTSFNRQHNQTLMNTKNSSHLKLSQYLNMPGTLFRRKTMDPTLGHWQMFGHHNLSSTWESMYHSSLLRS